MAPSRLPSGRMACAPWGPWMLTGPTAPPQVYEDTSALVVSCIDGYNVAIIAYGQTGSGKVWPTMAAVSVICPTPCRHRSLPAWLPSRLTPHDDVVILAHPRCIACVLAGVPLV